MKTAAKRLLGHPTVWRALSPMRRAGVVVLTYHRIGADPRFTHITADVFRSHMRWIRENCDVIDPGEVKGRVRNSRGRPRPPVLVTFDDGYRDYHDVAYPILRECHVPAINFLPTRFIDDGALFWWDMLDAAAAASPKSEAPDPQEPGRPHTLGDLSSRRAYAQLWKSALKNTAVPDRSPVFERALEALGMDRASVALDRQVMTWDQIRATTALTTYGGHTHTHPIMSLLDDAALDREVGECRDRIAAETGATPRTFAYPSGAHNERAKAAVARGGYELAFSTIPGFNAGSVDWMAVRRVHAPRTADRLPVLLSGWQ